ncbi:MAG TPA: hypothetical protein VFW29_05595 [Solirubrobacteraceae bacterium]|nr:hypothetical protein [Solirubrobacteraceae bacterium]
MGTHGERAGRAPLREPQPGEQGSADDGGEERDRQALLNWAAWHAAYEQPDSVLGKRLALVQGQIRGALDRAPEGPLRAVSICAGQGHDLIGVLADHPRRSDVTARLVELDEQNVQLARGAAAAAGLTGVEVVAGDASVSDAYLGAVPADLVIVCGVFGNISARDVLATVARLPELCAPGATVVWTRHRNPPDLVPRILEAFEQAGFEAVGSDDAPPFWVGVNRLLADPRPLQPGVKLFEFVGQDALWPHLDASVRAALGALFRPDCSMVELVEAMRALPIGLPSDGSVQAMLREGRGTAVAKHLFLAQVLGERFAAVEPRIVHRVHQLERRRARELYGEEVAAALPAEGLTDVHRYITIKPSSRHITGLERTRVPLDVTVAGSRWNGCEPLEPVCGPGRDFPAGLDPAADLRALEWQYCDPRARAPYLSALGASGLPPEA